MTKKTSTDQNSLFEAKAALHAVKATFVSEQETTFEDLIAGYRSMRVLTYSNSTSIIIRAAETIDTLEVIFGREDILNDIEQYVHFQDLLLNELLDESHRSEILIKKIEEGKVQFLVIQEMVSHEKLFLLEGEQGTRVITGSANFSERAFSGNQNESYVIFDNDAAAWTYFCGKYTRIRATSTTSIAKKVFLDSQAKIELENLPIFSPGKNGTPTVIVVIDRPPAQTIIGKIVSQRLPKQYSGLGGIFAPDNKGVVRIDGEKAARSIHYVKSHSRTETTNPEQFLSIYRETGQVILSGKKFDLAVDPVNVASDVELLTDYFRGFEQFRGDPRKLARDYFTFMSWFYISPFICDFRNRALNEPQGSLSVLDYPVFGILYGKSNCGKSELLRTLLLSMFQQEGFLQNDWFAKSQVAGLRDQNKRYPLVFDDLDKIRFTNHAIPIIKDDDFMQKEYPVIVLSMNADKDTYESEVRKRCLIIYTGASLPDHTGESQKLQREIRQIKNKLGNALYSEYLHRVLEHLNDQVPSDVLEFSSTILSDIFREHLSGQMPDWCRVTTMDTYMRGKHDKVKNELRELWLSSPKSWTERGSKLVLRLEDVHGVRKLIKDVPDYLVGGGSSGDGIMFNRAELESFLEIPLRRGVQRFWQRLQRT